MYVQYFNISLSIVHPQNPCNSWETGQLEHADLASESRVVMTIEAYDFDFEFIFYYLKIKKWKSVIPKFKEDEEENNGLELVKSIGQRKKFGEISAKPSCQNWRIVRT